MDFVDLQVFKCVVDEGGIIKAARKLHRVPSSVTTRIKQLETSLGVMLFHRDRQRLHLSPTGELLLAYAERLIQLS
ncbi:MAG: LysR family transcriptional regulator, partial [Xanthobacteraceae bacterium]